jgi:hypothetical protein
MESREIVPWEDLAELFAMRLPPLGSYYALLSQQTSDGYALNRGTATLVESHRQRFILTAAHVVHAHAGA